MLKNRQNLSIKIANVVLGLSLIALTGCGVRSLPIEGEAHVQRADADKLALFAGQTPISGKISLYEAIARGIKYNLDHRVKIMEEVVSGRDLRVANLAVLPQISARAGYTSRSNQLASNSFSIDDNTESLRTSTSSERDHRVGELSLVWNVLDFGISYLNAKQSSDRAYVFEERRRKVAQNVVLEIQQAYWDAYNAQQYIPLMDELINEVEGALAQSKSVEAARLVDPKFALEYRENLLSTLQRLWSVRERMKLAHIQLASLINVAPGQQLLLIKPQLPSRLNYADYQRNLPDFERFALINRPELREEAYERRIATTEVRKSLLRMFPGIEFSTGLNSDDNRFLLNNDWSSSGLFLTWNLFNVISGPRQRELAEAGVELADLRRLQKSMAVLAQINLAVQQLGFAERNLDISNELENIKAQRYDISLNRQAANTGNELDTILTKVNYFASQLAAAESLAEVFDAKTRIAQAVGYDLLPTQVASHSIADLSQSIHLHISAVLDLQKPLSPLGQCKLLCIDDNCSLQALKLCVS